MLYIYIYIYIYIYQETLRLLPPVWGIPKLCEEETVLRDEEGQEYRIPKQVNTHTHTHCIYNFNHFMHHCSLTHILFLYVMCFSFSHLIQTRVRICAYALHRNPKYWEDPDTFKVGDHHKILTLFNPTIM